MSKIDDRLDRVYFVTYLRSFALGVGVDRMHGVGRYKEVVGEEWVGWRVWVVFGFWIKSWLLGCRWLDEKHGRFEK